MATLDTREVGDVLEFETSMVLESAGYACMILTEVDATASHGIRMQGRFLGSDNKLTNQINRRKVPLHLCWETPCGYSFVEG